MLLYYLIFITVMSVIAFIMYYVDKERAIDEKRRISEKALLLISVFGGAAGGYLAMNIFRHKTRVWYFNVVNILFIFFDIIIGLLITFYIPYMFY